MQKKYNISIIQNVYISADLSRLIPNSYTKKGRGRIEKTEIIEMAIKHIRHLQNHPCQSDGKI